MTNLNTELYDAFLEARVKETTARAAAQSVTSNDQVATKADIAEVNKKIAGVETELSAKIAEVETRLSEKIAKMEINIATLTGIQQEQRWLFRMMVVGIGGILVKLIFFPS